MLFRVAYGNSADLLVLQSQVLLDKAQQKLANEKRSTAELQKGFEAQTAQLNAKLNVSAFDVKY